MNEGMNVKTALWWGGMSITSVFACLPQLFGGLAKGNPPAPIGSPTIAKHPVGPDLYRTFFVQVVAGISRLLAAGARVWRTDECGTIVIVSDGTNYTNSCNLNYYVYLPLIMKQEEIPPILVADLKITALSGTTTPEYVIIQNVGTGGLYMTGWTLFSRYPGL
jgi:hypothetical protein